MLHFERTNSNVKTCGISMWKIEIVLCYPRGCTWFVFVEIFQIRRKPEWASSVWLLGSLRINRFLTLIAKYIIWTNERDDIKNYQWAKIKRKEKLDFWLLSMNDQIQNERRKSYLFDFDVTSMLLLIDFSFDSLTSSFGRLTCERRENNKNQ